MENMEINFSFVDNILGSNDNMSKPKTRIKHQESRIKTTDVIGKAVSEYDARRVLGI